MELRTVLLAAITCGLIAGTGACAMPGNTPPPEPSAVPTTTQPAPAQVDPSSRHVVVYQPGEIGTARSACVSVGRRVGPPVPRTDRSLDPDYPVTIGDDTELALQAQRDAIPTRGVIPEAEVYRARSCALVAQWELKVSTDNLQLPLDDVSVRSALTAAHFDAITVEPTRFSARVGKTCVLGTITEDEAPMIITAVPPTGDCDLE